MLSVCRKSGQRGGRSEEEWGWVVGVGEEGDVDVEGWVRALLELNVNTAHFHQASLELNRWNVIRMGEGGWQFGCWIALS